MQDSNLTKVTFGGGAAETFISPITLVAMVVAIALVLTLPRRKVVVPVLIFIFLTPLGQNFYLAGLHIFAQRIVILCGCIRVLFLNSGSEESGFGGGRNRIDKIFFCWAACRAVAFCLLYREVGAVVNQFGFIWDFVGGYVLIRHLIRDREDIRRAAKVMAFIAVVMAVCMAYEHVAVTNVFGRVFGGSVTPDIRNGKVRARGVFGMEILASTFGGTLVPLFIWLWHGGKAKIAAIFGVVAAVVITMTASSSTGISALLVGVGALCCWPIRKRMKILRWGIVVAILGLAVVMKAPVWFILARVDFAGGSTGWDRANLIDQFVRHFGDWWIVGTNDFAKWGDFTWDQCNQYVAEGEQGGLATLILFVGLLVRSFSKIGVARNQAENTGASEWLPWALGAVLCAHAAGYFGISYFDQSRVWWFVTLAMVSVVTVTDASGLTNAVTVKRDRLESDEFLQDEQLQERPPVSALHDSEREFAQSWE